MPVLTATGAGVRHRRRWLFQDLDVSVEPGEIVAVVGPPGSGRTTVLLALSHRFKLTAGRVTGAAALGWVPDVTSPEPVLTVIEHVRERLLLIGRPPREAGQVPLLGLDPQLKGYELSPFQRQLLGIVLARLERPRVIALDAVDEGLDAGETRELWARLESLAEDGVAVLVTAREVDPGRVSTVVRLGAVQAPAVVDDAAWQSPAEVREADQGTGTETEAALDLEAPAQVEVAAEADSAAGTEAEDQAETRADGDPVAGENDPQPEGDAQEEKS
ncbi:ATP-binding cassette domain-containing protein [Actinoplanes sp. NPDC048967]|uniref:ABC transporter ATP-binding protein n=1 Tax=Actinoplanes sp. NPDC048967 TaxID=3155269 RepID=UPI0033C80BB9